MLSDVGEEILPKIQRLSPQTATLAYKNEGVVRTSSNSTERVYELAAKGYWPSAILPGPLEVKFLEGWLPRIFQMAD